MSVDAMRAQASAGGAQLLIPRLAPFYDFARPLAFTALRIAFGLTIITHGLPKLLGTSHGSMANPLTASEKIISEILGLPFAPQLATVVALLEAFGGLGMALGLGTRVFAPMLAVQMAFISVALGPTYPWIDRGMEYPLILGAVALFFAIHGGGVWSVDRAIGREV